MAKNITVEIRKAVDSYHKLGAVIDVPNDDYHRGLIDHGSLARVEEVKAAEQVNLEPDPAADEQLPLETEVD